MRIRLILAILLVLLMVQPSYSQSGSQQIHSRIEFVINWSITSIDTDSVVFRIIANVEIWNEASTNENLIFPFDCTSKLATNIILENPSLYDGIETACGEGADVREYASGLTTDTFSVGLIFNDPDLRTLPDGSYDIWLPVAGGLSLTAQILVTEGSNLISYAGLPEEWGANDNRPTPSLRNDQLDIAEDNNDLGAGQNTLTSTLVVGDAIKYTFAFGILAVILAIIFFIRKNYLN